MKKHFKIIMLSATIIVMLLALCMCFCGKRTLKIQTLDGQIITYQVERALTPSEQQRGLMNRTKLEPKTGMIFLFFPIRVARMWMKNTLIPLDMVFFDRQGRVIGVHYNAIPHDETTISSIRPVAGVLEINAGEAKKYRIEPGSVLDLTSVR